MKKKYVIGLDLGTTSAKAVLFTKDGHVHGEAEYEYPTHHPVPGWAEQNSLEIEQACILALRDVRNHANDGPIQAIGISAAMHSMICVGESGESLSPALIWADGRSKGQAETLEKEIYYKTGTPLHPMSPLAKLIWMKENDYAPYHSASYFMSIKEFLVYRWFGVRKVDYSMASATGLFNLETMDWDGEAIKLAGIRIDQLGQPVPSEEILQGLRRETAEEIGIPADVPFVMGASDGVLANIGIGAIRPQDIAVTVGTSGAIRRFVDTPATDPQGKTFCYRFSDEYSIIGGATNNGGNVLRWMGDVLGGSPEELLRSAEAVPPGANGLLFLPFLNGERAPYWNSDARGSYIGLSSFHKKEHMIRAGLEGVIFSLYSIGEVLEAQSGKPERLLASGGFSRSPLWLQMLADVFGLKVEVPSSHQSSAWGAAWVALLAIGEAASIEEICGYIPMREAFLPNQESHIFYQELYSLYKETYYSLEKHFGTLSKLQGRIE